MKQKLLAIFAHGFQPKHDLLVWIPATKSNKRHSFPERDAVCSNAGTPDQRYRIGFYLPLLDLSLSCLNL